MLRLFPADLAFVRRLYLSDTEFRSICEDYALARETVSRLACRSPGTAGSAAPEIEDYRTLIAGLEAELGHYVSQAKREQTPRTGGQGSNREVP